MSSSSDRGEILMTKHFLVLFNCFKHIYIKHVPKNKYGGSGKIVENIKVEQKIRIIKLKFTLNI